MTTLDDAVADLIEFVAEDAINSGRALPCGRGVVGPDVTTMERLVAAVHEAAQLEYGSTAPTVAEVSPAPSSPAGLQVVRPIGHQLGGAS